MITGSLIKDSCPRILLIFNLVKTINFFLIVDSLCCDVKHLFQRKTFLILYSILHDRKILVAAFNVVAINIHHIIECSVQSSAMLDILFCRIRTWFLTLLTSSVVSLPMMKSSESAFPWTFSEAGFPVLS